MKNLFLKLMTIACVVTSVPALAGTKDGVGGGNGAFSTEEDVREILIDERLQKAPNGSEVQVLNHRLYSDLWESYLVLSQTGAFEPTHIEDPELKELLMLPIFRFRSSGTSLDIDHNNPIGEESEINLATAINLLVSQPVEITAKAICLDQLNNASDSNTSYTPGAPICFSIDRLRRYPKKELRVQLMALLYHELLHQVGIKSERLAVKFQNYLEPLLRSIEPALLQPSIEGNVERFFIPLGETQEVRFSHNRVFYVQCGKSQNSPLKMKDSYLNTKIILLEGSSTSFDIEHFSGDGDRIYNPIHRFFCLNYKKRKCRIDGNTLHVGLERYLSKDPQRLKQVLYSSQKSGLCDASSKE